MTPQTQPSALRRILATLAALVAAGSTVGIADQRLWAMMIPAALLALSALMIHPKSWGWQVFARAIWWSNLLLGVLVAASASGHQRDFGTTASLACGAALLIAGRGGLEQTAGRYRSTLLALLVMALADARGRPGTIEMPRVLNAVIVSLAICALMMFAAYAGLIWPHLDWN